MSKYKFRICDADNKLMTYHTFDSSPSQEEKHALGLMSHTGLSDDNGVDIYEGDIIEVQTDETTWSGEYCQCVMVGEVEVDDDGKYFFRDLMTDEDKEIKGDRIFVIEARNSKETNIMEIVSGSAPLITAFASLVERALESPDLWEALVQNVKLPLKESSDNKEG